jgi:PmbA protein
VTRFYTDLATAVAIGAEPTGNGFRSGIQRLPSPGLSNLIMNTGGMPSKNIIQDCRRGILINMLMGAWAGNPYSGEVSGNIALGFLIENGEIAGRVKNAMISVNSFEIFNRQLVQLSSDAKWVDGGLLPYAVFDDVYISTKA